LITISNQRVIITSNEMLPHSPFARIHNFVKALRLTHSVLAYVLSLFSCVSTAWADELVEYRLKAAFLYNFISFTEWPAELGNTLNLCIYGPDPFGEEVDRLNGKKVGGRNLSVRRTNTAEGLSNCQIVFITQQVIGNLPRVLESLNGKPVLTISDTPGSARQGVILNMNLEQNNILFNANLSAARTNKLILSSKLLRLAKEVYE
jgi:hypothetical protein